MSRRTTRLTFFQLPLVGSLFTILSGLSFLIVCMILPLVGRAGAATTYAGKSFVTFLGVLLFSMGLGVLAVVSKLERRKVDDSPLPYFSLGLCGLSLLLLVALLTGLLSI